MTARWVECPDCYRANPLGSPRCERCQRELSSPVDQPQTLAADIIHTDAGDFALTDIVGSGGMSTVYSARRVGPGEPRQAAVKLLLDRWVNNARARSRFEREAHTLQQIRHPGIVEIFGTGTRDGRLALVLELVEGHDLRTELDRVGVVPWTTASTWCADLLDALEAVHAAGFVHRDVKPSNVLLDTRSQPPHLKLADLGVARSVDAADARLTRDGSMGPGTVHYMSPEQIKSGDTTARSDLYAVGVMLYELIVGEAPFEADSDYEIQRAHVEVEPDIVKLALHSPGSVVEVVKIALAKAPESRPGSASAMASLLREAVAAHLARLDSEPTTDGNPGPAVDAGSLVSTLVIITFAIIIYLVTR